MTSTIVTLDEIPIMCIRAESGPAGSKAAFSKLEAVIGPIRGRRFYGTIHRGEYRAGVAIREGDDPDKLGLERAVIPSGTYARSKLKEWPSQVHRIHQVFAEMIREHGEDEMRPSIEFYRSHEELLLYLPVAASASSVRPSG